MSMTRFIETTSGHRASIITDASAGDPAKEFPIPGTAHVCSCVTERKRSIDYIQLRLLSLSSFSSFEARGSSSKSTLWSRNSWIWRCVSLTEYRIEGKPAAGCSGCRRHCRRGCGPCWLAESSSVVLQNWRKQTMTSAIQKKINYNKIKK